MGPHLTTTYTPTSLDIFRSLDQWLGIRAERVFVRERKSANVWGEEKQGVWVLTAVSRETGVCLEMIYRVRCVCSGDAADHCSVFDLATNAHSGVAHKQTAWRVATSAASASHVQPRTPHWQTGELTLETV